MSHTSEGTSRPTDLTEAEARRRLAELAAQLSQANAAYYQADAPTLDDADYDALKRENAFTVAHARIEFQRVEGLTNEIISAGLHAGRQIL